MNGLHVDSVTKSFDGKQILTDVYLGCKKGEIVGLLGLNGSGKSTLLQIIFGARKADTKFIRIDDKVITGSTKTTNPIKYLPQNHFLPKHLKVSTLIKLFCTPENGVRIKSHPVINISLHKKPLQLSGGERRLLEVLLLIYSNSEYTLLDEPFNGIAPVYKDEIKSLLKKQSREKGFIITDHDYRNILDVATRIILIHDGATKHIKNKDELIQWGYIP